MMEEWLTISLPVAKWQALIECLGPDGVGWGEYSHPKEDEFVEALKFIEDAFNDRP